LQGVIREKFADRTVITIAHRLYTILDSDRILVMDNGRAAEFDSPKKLLEIPGGIFATMSKHASLSSDDSDRGSVAVRRRSHPAVNGAASL